MHGDIIIIINQKSPIIIVALCSKHKNVYMPDEIMPPRLYIKAVDRPTILYIYINIMMSAQQTFLPENASQNKVFLPKVY